MKELKKKHTKDLKRKEAHRPESPGIAPSTKE